MVEHSNAIKDLYTQTFTKRILLLLQNKLTTNKRSLWLGRPTIDHLQHILHHMPPAIPKSKSFISTLSEWYYLLIQHADTLWRIRNLEIHEPMDLSETSGSGMDPNSISSVTSMTNLEIGDLIKLLQKKRRFVTRRPLKIMGTVQCTLSECLSNTSRLAKAYVNYSSQLEGEENGNTVSPLTCSSQSISQTIIVTNYSDDSQSSKGIIDLSSTQSQLYADKDEGHLLSGEEHSAGRNTSRDNQPQEGILYGDVSTYNDITFPNEPNLTAGSLITLHDGKSVHSTIMSCALLLFRAHFTTLRERTLFVYYTFLQQLIAGRPFTSLYKQFLALTNQPNLQGFEKAYLLVHLDISGGHWTFIEILFGAQTVVSYHDSIDALRHKFEEMQSLLHQFLTELGYKNIMFLYGQVAQQEDGCSCGIFALAGVISQISNTHLTVFNPERVSAFRKALFYSIVQNRLSKDTLLAAVGSRKRSLLGLMEGHRRLDNNSKIRRPNDRLSWNLNNPSTSTSLAAASNGKRSLAQSLITDIFKSTRLMPCKDSDDNHIKRTRTNSTGNPEQECDLKSTKRKLTKKLKLKEGIFPKTYD
jgi:hypothetical protein